MPLAVCSQRWPRRVVRHHLFRSGGHLGRPTDTSQTADEIGTGTPLFLLVVGLGHTVGWRRPGVPVSESSPHECSHIQCPFVESIDQALLDQAACRDALRADRRLRLETSGSLWHGHPITARSRRQWKHFLVPPSTASRHRPSMHCWRRAISPPISGCFCSAITSTPWWSFRWALIRSRWSATSPRRSAHRPGQAGSPPGSTFKGALPSCRSGRGSLEDEASAPNKAVSIYSQLSDEAMGMTYGPFVLQSWIHCHRTSDNEQDCRQRQEPTGDRLDPRWRTPLRPGTRRHTRRPSA